jgi:hypothetical protein
MTQRIHLACLAVLSFATAGLCHAQVPETPKPTKEHEVLAQYVGDWDCVAQTVPLPGEDPIKCEGSATAKMVGGFWLVSEGKATIMGTPASGVLTVGYSPAAKKYVGTYICSLDSTLWNYTGAMDESGKKLILETEGTSVLDPTKKAKFRETLELKDKDFKTFTSEMQKDDGDWLTLVKIEYRRKK